ncbi:hypothetical protein BBK36DRAFT_1161188 [Trichoderma citrinoviride]|uniref:Uncharacterized protein n=1 Tax=Trichoderma citrinoviride TaxID=58853 RepID=A0A2T4B4E6_9HYPO|nr:hypothetical protein BBK36DRAFT_1161188 [Trichoderma citrinoviride]PTB64128.1 hypothetical protein BBK36DRAFT_1161188 [Trichoderma citrinoviride]
MMSLHHFIAIALTTSSLALAQDSPIPTKLLSNPVQPTAFSDDPALTTHRPLVIVTPSSGTDQAESTSSVILTLPDTTATLKDTLYVQTTMPAPSSPPTPTASGLFPQTTFPNFNSTTTTTTTTAAETSPSIPPSSPSSLTTLTGTKTQTLTSNPASVPTAFANAAAGLIALVGLAMAL